LTRNRGVRRWCGPPGHVHANSKTSEKKKRREKTSTRPGHRHSVLTWFDAAGKTFDKRKNPEEMGEERGEW